MISATDAIRIETRTTEVGALRVDVVTDLEGFAAMRAQWNELLRSSASDCPFLTWEWLHAWATHLRGSTQLRLLSVRRGEELIAVVPLMATRSRLGLFSQLEFLGTGGAGSDYLDAIARRDCEPEALDAIRRFLTSGGLALHLKHLAPTAVASRLAGHLADDGWTSRRAQVAVCPYIPLAGQTWESYLATVGSSHRANFRRRFKALGNAFQVKFEQVTADPQRQDALAALFAFHEQRWKTRGGSSAFESPALRAFHQDVTRRALDAGWLRMYALRLNDRVAAVMYGFSCNGRFYFYQHGFDEQYQSYSIGLVLMGLTIRAAIEDEGAVEFDLLYGNETYKSLWAREQRPLSHLHLFPARVSGTLHQRFLEVERTMRAVVRHFRSQGAPHAA